MKRSSHVSLLLVILLPGALSAALEWDRREQIIDTALETTELTSSFTFTNTGVEALVILEIRHSCGCTTTELEKEVYEPGESGTIEVRMKLEGLVGEQVKTISVYTSENPATPEILYLYTDVPVRYEVTPAILAWPMRSKPVPRSLQVRFHPDLAFDQASVEVLVEDRDNKGLSFTLETGQGRAPNELVIKLVPGNLMQPGHAYLTVWWNRPEGREKIGEAYLIVN